MSNIKSSDQRSPERKATGIGVRDPRARLRFKAFYYAAITAENNRGEGFNVAIDAVEGIVVVASQAADFDCTIGFNVMENIFQAQPDIGVVFVHNDKFFFGN